MGRLERESPRRAYSTIVPLGLPTFVPLTKFEIAVGCVVTRPEKIQVRRKVASGDYEIDSIRSKLLTHE